MNNRIHSALADVNKLLTAKTLSKTGARGVAMRSKKAAHQALNNAKADLRSAKPPRAKKEAQERVKRASARLKKLSSSVEGAANRTKILAMLGMGGNKPNLRLLNKMIQRGHITAPEVVTAVGEALRLRRVNLRVIEAIMMALTEALVTEDVIDVESAA